MKKLLLPLLLISTFAIQGQGLVDFNWFNGDLSRTSSTSMNREIPFDNYLVTDEEKRIILEQQYLQKSYSPAKVDQYKATAYLRYNLYNGQMEFAKDGEIYYLAKEKGRTVKFEDSNTLYKVYEVFGDLEFLKVKLSGKNSLLVKQSNKFIRPTKKASTYAGVKKPGFKRNKDELFIALSNGEVVEVPNKKKSFFGLFGKDGEKVKAFVKKEKLNHKKAEDLKKIVKFLNT